MDQTGGDFVLAKWLKHEGDTVQVGDTLCEVETNKANVELSAEAAGVLRKVLVSEGTALPSLTVIALIGGPGDALPDVDPYYRVLQRGANPSAATAPARASLPVTHTEPPAVRNEPPLMKRAGEVTASPRARKLAAEHQLDLSTLTGSGPDGRIGEDDVRRALQLP